MLNAFIDTNIYLGFYGFTAAELDELRKLRVAIANDQLRLWTTTHVRDELRRNRESKAAESMKALGDLKPSGGVPQMARNLPEFDSLKTARRSLKEQVNAVTERLSQQFADESLAADRVLQELMDAATEISVTDEILAAARRRIELGNPPGKKGSLGDAINWECLLAEGPSGQDLHFLTEDNDFASKMQPDQMAGFLATEWTEKRYSQIYLHRRLSEFLRERFPDIELATEFEKELRIQALVRSGSFADTHRSIARLSEYSDFTDQQARDLLEAAFRNSQIYRIAQDDDVQELFQDLVNAHADVLDEDELESFHELFSPPHEDAAELEEGWVDF